MAAHSKEVAKKFCERCNWLLEVWQLRKFLFDENPDLEILRTPHHQDFFHRLHVIIQEYWRHEVAKLHDPSTQHGSINLTIDYMIEFGGWDAETKSKLENLRAEMIVLSKPIKAARNKIWGCPR